MKDDYAAPIDYVSNWVYRVYSNSSRLLSKVKFKTQEAAVSRARKIADNCGIPYEEVHIQEEDEETGDAYCSQALSDFIGEKEPMTYERLLEEIG